MILSCDSVKPHRSTAPLRRLRTLALCGLLAASASSASAADMPDNSWLRGSLSSGPVNWDGLVMGAQVGYSSMNADFGSSTSSEVAFILRDSALEDQFAPSTWTTLPSKTANSKSFNAFLGYNWQINSDLVLGVDFGYNRPQKLEASASDSITRVVTLAGGGTIDTTTINASSSLKLVDYATFRGRAGYAFGQFLPYVVLGGGLGRFNYTNTAVVNVDQNTGGVHTPFTGSQTESKNNAFAGGWLYGGGIDIAVMPNVFVRGEWEYVAFAKVGGIRSTVSTARAGIGIRF